MAGRRKLNKTMITITLYPETKAQLDRAAEAAGMEKSAYIEAALHAQFERKTLKKYEPPNAPNDRHSKDFQKPRSRSPVQRTS
jgi:hypothetical protein